MPAGNNRINIVISLKNQASAPLKQVRKDMGDLRSDLVQFNRKIFTATALYATYRSVFVKAFEMAKVGSEFDYFRQQFNATFGSSYLSTLKTATKGTMDAMAMMRVALQNQGRGLSKTDTQEIFGLSYLAAKKMGTTTEEAADKMSRAFQTISKGGMQQFLVALNTNNEFTNTILTIKKFTKGLNAAEMETSAFRRIVLKELRKSLNEVAIAGGDAKTVFMQWNAGLSSFREGVGTLISRAMVPLLAKLSDLTWDGFDRLNDILDETNAKTMALRKGLVDFIQVGGAIGGVTMSMIAGFTLLSLVAAPILYLLGGIAVAFGAVYGAVNLLSDSKMSFIDTLATMGTMLKFWFQAFSTYNEKGEMTTTADMVQRLKEMTPALANTIITVAEAFALAGAATDGFKDGLQEVYDTTVKLLTVLSKIPIIGKLFKAAIPDGTQFNPILDKIARKAGKYVGSGGLELFNDISKIPSIPEMISGKSDTQSSRVGNMVEQMGMTSSGLPESLANNNEMVQSSKDINDKMDDIYKLLTVRLDNDKFMPNLIKDKH